MPENPNMYLIHETSYKNRQFFKLLKIISSFIYNGNINKKYVLNIKNLYQQHTSTSSVLKLNIIYILWTYF